MDLQTFIQSGLLESYVLGQATAEERSLVEQMLRQHAEARTELAAIEQAVERYALAQATPPPAWMKGRILEQLEQQVAPPPAAPGASAGSPRLYQLLALALLLTTAFFWNKNSQLQTQLAERQTQLTAVQNKLDDCSQRTESIQQMASLIRDADTKVLDLKNGPDGGKAKTLLYVNEMREEVGIDLLGMLAPSTEGKYLQFWAVVDGVPISLGMIPRQAANSWMSLKHHGKVDYFAVSEENNPNGNVKPTIVVMQSYPHGNG